MQQAGASGLGSCPHRPRATMPPDQVTSLPRTRPRPPPVLGVERASPLWLPRSPVPALGAPLSCSHLPILPTAEALHSLPHQLLYGPSHAWFLHTLLRRGLDSNIISAERSSRPDHFDGAAPLPGPRHCICPAALHSSYHDLKWYPRLVPFLAYCPPVLSEPARLNLYESRNLAHPFNSYSSRAWNSVCKLLVENLINFWQNSF